MNIEEEIQIERAHRMEKQTQNGRPRTKKESRRAKEKINGRGREEKA